MATKQNDRLVAIMVLEAHLTNTSPLLIGSGSNEAADKEIILRPDKKPYIPGTALAGKLLRRFNDCQDLIPPKTKSHIQFWGGEYKYQEENKEKIQPYQSHIIIEDACWVEGTPSKVIRDGVRINHQTNLAEDKGKFDYELLEPGCTFAFRAEIKIRESFKKEDFQKMGQYLLELVGKDFRIGASEKAGFGKLECKDAKAYWFEFPTDEIIWFDYLGGIKPTKPYSFTNTLTYTPQKTFQLTADFTLKSTLLTAAAGVDASDPDKVQLSRKNGAKKEFILSGAAIRGALKHRALRILKVQGKSQTEADNFLNNLFGFVTEVKAAKLNAKKSRLRAEESAFSKDSSNHQTRIKIDRFTGGTISGALLDAKPITCSDRQTIQLVFNLPDYTPQEVELMLYLLKDLMLSDLAIGGEKNIGRGILVGQNATLRFDGTDTIEIASTGINTRDLARLKTYLPV